MGTCCCSTFCFCFFCFFCKFWNNICKTLFVSESNGVVSLEVSLSLPAECASWPGSDISSRGEVERWVISPDGHSRERGSMRGSYFDKTITVAVASELSHLLAMSWFHAAAMLKLSEVPVGRNPDVSQECNCCIIVH